MQAPGGLLRQRVHGLRGKWLCRLCVCACVSVNVYMCESQFASVCLCVHVCVCVCLSVLVPLGGQLCVSVVNTKSTSCGVGLLEPQFYHLGNRSLIMPVI